MNNKVNLTLLMVLGSALAVGCTSTFDNAVAAAFAAVVSVVLVALLANVLKSFIKDMKTPALLVITAGVGAAVMMLTNALFPAAYKATAMYLVTLSTSLLAYTVAARNEGLGSAVKNVCYFAAVLVVLGFVRELVSVGKVMGNAVEFMSDYTVSVFGQVPGGLILFGLVLALFNKDGYRFNVKDVVEEPVVEEAVEAKEGE